MSKPYRHELTDKQVREEYRWFSALDQLPPLLGDFGRWVAREYPPEVSDG